MTFDEFFMAALTVDPECYVSEDSDGFLTINTNYKIVGGPDVPLGYLGPSGWTI
jgi:hypothetical protein